MNFKEMLDKDLDTTFFNTAEFAEVHRVKYGEYDKKIPLVFDLEEQKERKVTAQDNAEGIHTEISVIRVKLSDLPREPRQGARLFIDGELFTVRTCDNQYNELIIELERFDE